VKEVLSFADFGYGQLMAEAASISLAFALLVQRVLERFAVEEVTVLDHTPLSVVEHLRAGGLRVTCRPDALLRERALKGPSELEALHAVQRVNEQSMQLTIDAIASSSVANGQLVLDGMPLTSERLHLIAQNAFLAGNCYADTIIAAGGPQGAAPHNPGSGFLHPHEPIVLDFFPQHRSLRYYADMTRTISKGDPGPRVREMFDATLRAQETAMRMIGPGVNGRDVYTAVCHVYEQAGFATSLRSGQYPAEGFIHGLGHGIGLEIHEEPGLRNRDQVLEPGHVVTVEPGLYFRDVGGVRIEDVVVVTDHGCDCITRFAKRLLV
jgi:Xaa-Pro aminopeptidase